MVKSFLGGIISVCNVVSYFHDIIFKHCLSDKDVKSLMKDSGGRREWEIIWIPSPATPSTSFEAEVLLSDVADWLEDKSLRSSTSPWNQAVASEIASFRPEPLTKTGSRYTSEEPSPIHCEIALLLWLIHRDIPVDMHIGCSDEVCYFCSKLAQALGAAYRKHDVALPEVFKSNKPIQLPWTCPPDVPDAVIEPLRTIILDDLRLDALTYATRHDLFGNAVGFEVPEFPPHDK